MNKVFINPGHAPDGIPDPGATGQNGLRECDVALKVGEYLKEYLEAAYLETQLLQSDSLSEVCSQSDNWNADIFVSIHCNGFTNPEAKGMEIYTSLGDTEADPLATRIMRQLIGEFSYLYVRSDFSDGDIDKEAGLYVLNNTNAPAVLVELAFITNPNEEALLRDENNLKKYAAAIARGITDYFLKNI